jgi:predicted nucleotidyltransferase
MTLPELARELKTTDRTLRRAVELGTLRVARPSPRKVVLPIAERAYLRRHWGLLSALRETLRTEPAVSMAVLFGSRARGDEHAGSDVDLVVALRGGGVANGLEERLSRRLGMPVQIVTAEDAERVPLLLAEVIREGRILVDREGQWSTLTRRRKQIQRAADRQRREIDVRFEAAFAA